MHDITCPYCGHEFSLDHDDGTYLTEGASVDTECPDCEETFQVTTSISYRFEGSCADDKHDWVKERCTWWDDEWTRKKGCAGEPFYTLNCTRKNCEGIGRHLTEEEFNAHPAPEKVKQ